MARHNDDRNKLVAILSENPLVNYACQKVGISRATFYRWVKDNPTFKKQVEEALGSGRLTWTEVAEAALFKNVKGGNMGAIKYYLGNNDDRYKPSKPTIIIKESKTDPVPKDTQIELKDLPQKEQDKINRLMGYVFPPQRDDDDKQC